MKEYSILHTGTKRDGTFDSRFENMVLGYVKASTPAQALKLAKQKYGASNVKIGSV